MIRNLPFLPLWIRPSMSLGILKYPVDYFPLSPCKFWMRWKKRGNSFLCCRNDKRNNFHTCPGAQIVKTDLELSVSHSEVWVVFLAEVRWVELNKLIWVSLVQAFLVSTYWGKKNILKEQKQERAIWLILFTSWNPNKLSKKSISHPIHSPCFPALRIGESRQIWALGNLWSFFWK